MWMAMMPVGSAHYNMSMRAPNNHIFTNSLLAIMGGNLNQSTMPKTVAVNIVSWDILLNNMALLDHPCVRLGWQAK
tara:strand:+ start:2422 stop:2649 length:228 start_codon:yes stop_codon:yes gene_type:complete